MDIQLEKKNSVHRLARGIVALALIVFALLCLWLFSLFTTEKVTLIPKRNTTLHVAQRGKLTDTLVTRAVAIPRESVIITSGRGGTVTSIRQSASGEVKKGEVIASLSNDDFVLQMTSRIAEVTEQINNLRSMRRLLEKDDIDTRLAQQDARYHMEKNRREVGRQKTLYERGLMEKATYEQLGDELMHWQKRYAMLTAYQQRQESLQPVQLAEIEASLAHLQKLTRLIENGLNQLVITAPIDGILSPLTIKIGQQIKPGEKVANLDNPQTYDFEASFSEYYLDKITPGDSVNADYAGLDIPLTITSVSSVVENGKFNVKLVPTTPQTLPLKRGQSVNLRVSLETAQDTLHIPSAAVFRQDKQTWVYLYDEENQRALKTPVGIKRQGETRSEVGSGVSAGQQVVVFTDSHMDKSDIIEFE